MLRLFLCMIVFLFSGFLAAQETKTREIGRFYLDSEKGDDSDSGRSPDQAWKTLKRLNREQLVPGDTVLLKRGGLWREQLLPKSGAPGKPIVYDVYGEGEKPILQGSTQRGRTDDWKPCGRNLWETTSIRPLIGKNVSMDFAASWHVHQEKPAEVRIENRRDGERTVVRLTVKAQGERSSRIQLIGPTVSTDELPESAVVKIRARSTKPFVVPSIVVRKPDAPWNNYLQADRAVSVSEQWKEFDVFLQRKELSGKGRLVFYLGGSVPDDSAFEFEILSLREARFPEDRMPLTVDVGNMIFDHGKTVGFKRWNLDELKEPGDFWHDMEGTPENENRVVLYGEKNPAEVHDSIELCLKRNVVNHGNLHDCVIRNLTLRYSAAHGVGGQGARRTVIEDCDIYYIGGGHLYTRDGRPTRYGNGIEWWSEAEDCLVRRCRLWEIYDVAFSPQGNAEHKTTKNITIRDCTIWNCEQSFEYWRIGEGSTTENVVFEHNTCVDAGFGWSHRQRPDKRGTHFLSYTVTVKTDIILRNNIFCRGENDLISMFCDWRDGVRLYNNLWWQPDGKDFLSMKGKGVFKAEEFQKYLDEYGIEKNSILAEPKFVDAVKRDYRLAPGSPGLETATDGSPAGRRDFTND